MELKQYFEAVKRWWYVALVAMAVTSFATVVFVTEQPDVYESTGTYVVRPRAVSPDAAIDAVDTLNRGTEIISSTFARIAESDVIRDSAEENVRPVFRGEGLEVAGTVVTGTNIIEITVQGPNPETVYQLAVAIGDEVVRYVGELDDAFVLAPLDAPAMSEEPVGPNRPLTVATGVALGATLGIVLAIVAQYLSESRVKPDREDAEPGHQIAPSTRPPTPALPQMGDERTFRYRLSEEMARADGAPFSLGILRIGESEGTGRDLGSGQAVKRLARQNASVLRPADVVADLGDGSYVVLFPGTPVEQAADLMNAWEVAIRSSSRAVGAHSSTAVGVYGYGFDDPAAGQRPPALSPLVWRLESLVDAWSGSPPRHEAGNGHANSLPPRPPPASVSQRKAGGASRNMTSVAGTEPPVRPVAEPPRRRSVLGGSEIEEILHRTTVAVMTLGERGTMAHPEPADSPFVPLVRVDSYRSLGEMVLVRMAADLDRPAEAAQLAAEIVAALGAEDDDAAAAIDTWARNRFFARHVAETDRNPEIWHLRSKEGMLHAFVYGPRCTRSAILQFRSGLIQAVVDGLKLQMRDAIDGDKLDDVAVIDERLREMRTFDITVGWLYEGTMPEARLRYPWRDDRGQPQGWAPDFSEGIRPNLTPLQRLGLLAAPVLRWEELEALSG